MHVVIGIGGGSNSGKTTICNKLREDIPDCYVFNQDKYFKTIQEARLTFTNCDINWEKCEALKMDNLVADVKRKVAEGTSKVIIVEGHLVLSYPPLVQLFDATVFITLPFSLALKRRLTRSYDPPDGPGYFENIVWPEYLSTLDRITNSNIMPIFLEATHPEMCYRSINDLVTSYLKN